jgi:hypothetical protein
MNGCAIHGHCDCCKQHDKLGLFLQDGKTDGLVFWCFACVDERSDLVRPVPPPADSEEEPKQEQNWMRASLKRLPSGLHRTLSQVIEKERRVPLAIHGNCDSCNQKHRLGLFLEDSKKDGLVFWCLACVDERSDLVVSVPPPADDEEEHDEDEREKSYVSASLKRLPSDVHPAFDHLPEEKRPRVSEDDPDTGAAQPSGLCDDA